MGNMCAAILAMIVWYFPGWMRTEKPQEGIVPALEASFPEAKVEFKAWNGDVIWPLATKNADEISDKFAAEIAAMSEEERGNLVLVGHSLGGRIAARVTSKLGSKGLKVKETILMGAALPYKDKDVEAMGNGSELPILAICNPKDVTLKYVYAAFGGEWSAAFGANGGLKTLDNCREYVVPASLVKEVSVDRFWADIEALREVANHHALFYAAALKKIVDGEELPKEVMVPQDFITIEWPVMDREVWWDIIEEHEGWKLERNKVTGHARILDPKKIRRAWGTLENLKPAFEKIVFNDNKR